MNVRRLAEAIAAHAKLYRSHGSEDAEGQRESIGLQVSMIQEMILALDISEVEAQRFKALLERELARREA